MKERGKKLPYRYWCVKREVRHGARNLNPVAGGTDKASKTFCCDKAVTKQGHMLNHTHTHTHHF